MGDVRTRDGGPPGAGILHLGLGSFHRAHQALYTDTALDVAGGDWGIVGVSSRSSRVVDAMRAQSLLYTVIEISPEGSSFRVPRAHSDVFVGAHARERVRSEIASARTRIISLTVTENGYTYRPSTGRLDLGDPGVQHDLANPDAPRTVIGQLARGLQLRASTHAEPVTVLSCDNLAENGRHTELLVREFAAALPASEERDLSHFLDSHVTFPSSMVDRIVPATTDHYRELVTESLGYVDAVPVPTEPFTMWVMEDRFAAGRPQWESAGAIFSDEVAGYEQVKMRLLNGTHSLIAYLGALAGCRTIPDAVAQDFIEDAARTVLRAEYLPSVTVPRGIDVHEYEAQLFVRWSNSALGHRTSQVGTDGSVKLRQRIPEPAIDLLNQGRMPHHLALTIAAYLTCVAPLGGFDPGPDAALMQDAARPLLASLADRSSTGRQLAERALVEHHLLGEALAQCDGFIDRVGELVDILHSDGPRAASRDAAQHDVTLQGLENGGTP
ncbi:MAG TPA: mannitol dehydrogenase family protein [Cellulomonadaceae bacterium]|nr:mannitol dehydrogenase family protein [Cellulomonadaceae bacterium]